MKVDLKYIIKMLDGRPLINENGKQLDLRLVICNALLMPDDGIDGQEKARRGMLAYKVYTYDGNEIDLDVSDIALIKALVGKFYQPLIVFQVWELLEGRNIIISDWTESIENKS